MVMVNSNFPENLCKSSMLLIEMLLEYSTVIELNKRKVHIALYPLHIEGPIHNKIFVNPFM